MARKCIIYTDYNKLLLALKTFTDVETKGWDGVRFLKKIGVIILCSELRH